MLEHTESILGSRPLTPPEKLMERSLLLPEGMIIYIYIYSQSLKFSTNSGANFVYQADVPNPKEVNSALVYQLQIGFVPQRELLSTKLLLLHMMREPAFDDLRTKQQLGYIVFVTRSEGRSVFGIRFTIQSEREPVYLESRVETFLEAYREQAAKMSQEEFERQKEGLISAKLQKLENLYSETNRFWSHINNGYLDFRRRGWRFFPLVWRFAELLSFLL